MTDEETPQVEESFSHPQLVFVFHVFKFFSLTSQLAETFFFTLRSI